MIPGLTSRNGNGWGVVIPASPSPSAPASSEQKTCTAGEARELTERIKSTTEQVCVLLLEAHDRKAWKALNYSTWAEYVRAEFDMSHSHSYRVLDQAKIIREITAVVDVPHGGQTFVSEREARDIKPVLAEVTADIRDQVATLPDPDPARVRQVVAQSVAEARQRVRERRADERDEAERILLGWMCHGIATGGEHQQADAAQDDSQKVVEAKVMPAPAQRSANRKPIPDVFFDATYDLTKAVDRLAQLVADDRFPRNAEQVATKHRSDLLRTVYVLADVINRLPTAARSVAGERVPPVARAGGEAT